MLQRIGSVASFIHFFLPSLLALCVQLYAGINRYDDADCDEYCQEGASSWCETSKAAVVAEAGVCTKAAYSSYCPDQSDHTPMGSVGGYCETLADYNLWPMCDDPADVNGCAIHAAAAAML